MKFDERIERALKSKLFFVICLLQTAGTVLFSVNGSIPVLDILTTVFLWLLYLAAGRDIIEPAYIRRLSGVIFAEYILNYVVSGLLLLMGVLLTLVASAVRADPTLSEAFDTALASLPAAYAELFDIMLSAMPAVALVSFAVVALLIVLFNVFYTRTLHRFVQSCYRRLEDPQHPVVKIGTVRKWLMVIGSIYAVETAFMLAGAEAFATMGYGTLAAAHILGGITIRRYLEE